MTRDESPSQRKYTRHPDNRHEDAMANDPNRAIELTQLVGDLKAVQGSVFYSHLGYTRIAEELYDRGVRSGLQLPGRLSEFAGTWLPVVSDPATGGAKSFGFLRALGDGAGVDIVLALDTKLVPSGFAPMSEVPGHVDVAPRPFECPHCGQRFTALENGADGEQRIPFHMVLFMTDTMKCRGSRERVAPGVPNPVPDRPLPEGVQHVIRFVQLLDFGAAGAGNRNWAVHIADGRGGSRAITTADLKAVLAEIPDVAPRYPTIWAYEQACRTIRERDDRIGRALVLADRVEKQLGDEIPGALDELRTALRLRMPRTVPATDKEKSDVARAFEACDTDDDAAIGGSWSTVARVLRDEALRLADEVEHLRTLGGAVTAEVLDRCPSCDHLVDVHMNGTGCFVTVRDVAAGVDSHCPCTFNARSEHGVRQEDHEK